MGLFINTNTSSLNAQRQLNNTTRSLGTSFERLSSGLRINGAKDDAAGLSITTRLGAQVRGLNQAVRNSNDGISLMQTAEGALNETTNILQRMRELAVQSANNTNNDADRASIQAEVSQLKDEIDRIAETTNFNGNKIFQGDFLYRDLQVGANVGETISVSVAGAASKDLGRQARYSSDINDFVDAAPLANLKISGHIGTATIRNSLDADDSLSTASKSASAIAKAAAINDSSDQTGVRAIVGQTELTLGAAVQAGTLDVDSFITLNGQKITGFAVANNDASGALVDALNAVSEETGVVAGLDATGALTLTAADGRNIALDVSDADAFDVIGGVPPVQAADNVGPNFLATAEITLQSDDVFELTNGVGIAFNDGVYGVNSDFAVSAIDLSTVEGSVTALDIIDLALEDVTSARADLGALQNRLDSTVNNLNTTAENLSASKSRILDADFAMETAKLSQTQIIQQAGVSILAQANQQPQIALSLLG